MTYYKFITADNQSTNGGTFDWTPYLPHDGQPGDWTPIVDNPEPCERGYHVTDAVHLIDWLNAQLFEVEIIGPIVHDDGNKWACQSIRLLRKIEAWNERTTRLFACWCVRQVWHLLTDERSKRVVEIAERYANGQATDTELSAARAAARDAAWDAARAAAGDAQSKHLIEILGLAGNNVPQ